jgi:hypothetical protein
MKTDSEALQQAIRLQGEGEPDYAPLTEKYKSWVDSLAASNEIKSVLRHLSLKDDFPLGTNCIFSWCDILNENRNLKDVFKQQFVVIGSGTSGDRVAIDIRTKDGRVGYLCHEDLWDDHEDIANLDDSFFELAGNFGSYALNAVTSKQHPLDFHGTLPE